MLISYPFLPAGLNTMTEYAQLQYMLGLVRHDEGLFPVSFGNRWHGGIHLAPGNDNEPVRAIADGEVVAYRVAAQAETYPSDQDRFDTSFVLIKHSTHSGENTPVVFYSLYMHLRSRGGLSAQQLAQLPAWLRNATPGPNAIRATQGTRIWRKDVLGFAGTLYNRRCLHFEVFATNTDFVGTPNQPGFWRDRNAIAQGRHGSNDVFGDIHYIIPAGRNFVARHPRAVAPHRIDLPGPNVFYDLPVGQAGTNMGSALHVVVRFTEGQRVATTFRILPSGARELLGDSVLQTDYEYELYRLATALYPDCPSAGYEYLRFGRILSSDRTTTNENWQLVRYSEDAIGYIDLASAGNNVSILSDADFPLSWQRLEEGQTASASDGICDVRPLLELIGLPPDSNGNGRVDEDEFFTHASRAAVSDKLRFFICKHPTEWDDSDLESRYRRLREPGQPLQAQNSWEEFSAHVSRMAFWSQAGIAERSVWHFHPLQFIRHYRNCEWLSSDEMAMTLPRHQFYTGTVLRMIDNNAGVDGAISLDTATQRLANHVTPLNKTMRKYGITTKKRQAHFLGQVIWEAAQWRDRPPNRRLLQEWFYGRYSTTNPATLYYAAFYGRGIMQLTWVGNYRSYGAYRSLPNHVGAYQERLTPAAPRITNTSTHYTAHPDDGGQLIQWAPRYDPDIVATDPELACDSGGFFWVSKHHAGSTNINRICDENYTTEEVGRVNRLVNGGGNGYHERQAYVAYLIRYLTDDTATAEETEIQTPRSRVRVNFLRPSL
ncbi:hypothetical protein [Pseudomonas paraeruginosa]|uniref:hypothetical protein n=1 Tax=Pseudomonas paraeruginosa TaxID=2994495 RepID=UPI0039FD2296